MKKLVSTLSALCLAAFCFTGCNKEHKKEEPKKNGEAPAKEEKNISDLLDSDELAEDDTAPVPEEVIEEEVDVDVIEPSDEDAKAQDMSKTKEGVNGHKNEIKDKLQDATNTKVPNSADHPKKTYSN
ncbi:hypothetical protein [Estrella lausannensis]|uniref:Uncharacterized protein n=1 Tax=Estrella lausannensis TaxID=483423 RepID=A0A0H5E4Z6_9BACT|nr:hypothetical protein [Estrella lausannensis]CRX38315.1 hypothetical protein ELAC_0969 [Estrella lausannensis]